MKCGFSGLEQRTCNHNKFVTRNSSRDETGNVNFLYDDV